MRRSLLWGFRGEQLLLRASPLLQMIPVASALEDAFPLLDPPSSLMFVLIPLPRRLKGRGKALAKPVRGNGRWEMIIVIAK